MPSPVVLPFRIPRFGVMDRTTALWYDAETGTFQRRVFDGDLPRDYSRDAAQEWAEMRMPDLPVTEVWARPLQTVDKVRYGAGEVQRGGQTLVSSLEYSVEQWEIKLLEVVAIRARPKWKLTPTQELALRKVVRRHRLPDDGLDPCSPLDLVVL